jgi:diguanylate cyclase (GGDEF)-like protein
MRSIVVSAQDGRQDATALNKSWIKELFFGTVSFGESEEYQEFQFKFLAVVVFLGALFTLLFIVGAYTGINPLNNPHAHSMAVFTAASFAVWLALRGHKDRFLTLAWTYEILCLLEYASALIFVSEDELRILWFYTNIPGVYILLGNRVGMAITALSLVGLAVGNAYLAKPYSPNAMATALVSLAYLALFFHVYGSRSISYFTRMREANQRLLELASHDMLTGVLNARAYYQRCDALISMAHRDGLPFSVLFVDLDHFKAVNDNHGHAAGDLVLKAVATSLARSIRQSDEIGRIGGEEFSIFLPNTSLEGARQLAETIRQAIESLMPDTGQQRLKITASIGVADDDHQQKSMRAIQQRADAAMYIAKASGRNKVSCFMEQSFNF